MMFSLHHFNERHSITRKVIADRAEVKSMSAKPVRDGAIGSLLREWRRTRRISQLQLAVEANVSQRHISFIESGRSAPSRDVILMLADALDVPLAERNELLLAGGFAPAYGVAAWNEPEMRSIQKAVKRMLLQQEPYPAILMDRYWNVIDSNDATQRFFGSFIDMQARQTRRNLLLLMFDPRGMRPFLDDWERVSESLLQRVRRESLGHTLDDRMRNLLSELMSLSEPNSSTRDSSTATALPMVPLSFHKDGALLRYFSMLTTVAAPQSATAQELRLECLFPADDVTEELHARIMRSGER